MLYIYMVTFTINIPQSCEHQSTIHTDPLGNGAGDPKVLPRCVGRAVDDVAAVVSPNHQSTSINHFPPRNHSYPSLFRLIMIYTAMPAIDLFGIVSFAAN